MKICLLTYRGNPFSGGQGVYVHYLSRELVRLGHEVEVYSGPPYPFLADGVRLNRVKSLNLFEWDGVHHPFRVPDVFHPWNLYEIFAVKAGHFPEPLTFSLRAFQQLKREWNKKRFDVIHDNQSLGYGLLLMKGLGAPVLATVHHPIPIDRDREIAQSRSVLHRINLLRWYSFTGMQGIVARRLQRLITVSNSSRDDIVRTFGIRPERLNIVYNGVDCDLFRPLEVPDAIPDGVIVTTSSNLAVKGFRYLLEAVALLKQRRPIRLTVVGNDDPESDGCKLVRRMGLDDAVRFTGRLDVFDLVREYARHKVAVVPSLYEGFGLPAAEAMACGLPVVSTTAGGLPEVVGRDGEAGLMVPPADPAALAAAMERLLDNDTLRLQMGIAARKRVERNFTWRNAACKTVQVYEELRNC